MSTSKKSKEQNQIKPKSRLTKRLSVTKTRRIEKGFRLTVKETRTEYLSDQLDKYRNIEVAYD